MKKSDIAQAYEKYLGPKCSKTTYYINIKKGMNFIDALQPVPKEIRYRPGNIKSKRFAEELEWYQKQDGPKVRKNRFYQRLYQGWTKEEAIKVDAPMHRRKNPIVKQVYVRPKAPVKRENNKDREDIRIRYSKEEAWVFIVEYRRMISELEERYSHTDDMEEAREISIKLEKLVKEYQIFLECQSPGASGKGQQSGSLCRDV